MATISERLAYILTADNAQFVKSFQQAGAVADKELGKADSKLDKLGSNLTKVGAGAVAFAGIAGAGLVKLTMGASDLAESVNAVHVTFGEAADGILELGENAAHAVGLSKSEFAGLAVQFSSFTKTVAGDGGDVVKTMDTLTTRVADFASVMNLDVPEAAAIFQSALAGETEPIKKFGIDLSAASVAAFAVANGISDSAASMTEAEKVTARYGLLMQATAIDAGDFANTSDGLANSQRILKADLQNLADNIGTGILPMMTSVVGVVGKAAAAFASLSPETQGMIGKFAAIGVVGVGMLGTLSLIAGQLIKMRTRFTEVGEDGVRTLNNMGKAAKGMGIALGIATVALIAYTLNQQRDAKTMGESIDLMNELARLAADELPNAYRDMLVAGLMAGDGLSEVMKRFAETNLEAAIRVRDNADAIGVSIEQQDALTFAINTEIVARKQEASTTAAATAALEDHADAADAATEATEYAAVSVDAINSGLMTSIGVLDDTTGGTDDLTRANDLLARQIQITTDKYKGLKGELDAEEAFHNAEGMWAELKQSAVDAYTAASEHAEDAEQKAFDHQGAVIAAKQAVLDLGEQYADLPESEITSIIAMIDEGSLAEAEARFNILTRNRSMNVSIIAHGGAGYSTLPQFASGGDVPGPRGAPQLAIVHGGEHVQTAAEVAAGSNGSGWAQVVVPVTVQTLDGTISPAALAKLVEAINGGVRTGTLKLVSG